MNAPVAGRVWPVRPLNTSMPRRQTSRRGAKEINSVSNDEREHPRTLAGATVLQIVPALREEPAARTALNVAAALREIGARALVAAEDGPLVAELTASGGEWVPLVNATVNPFRLRRSARTLLRLIASGLPNHAIATKLSLSFHTVKNHVQNIFKKIDVTRRTEAVERARRQGWLDA